MYLRMLLRMIGEVRRARRSAPDAPQKASPAATAAYSDAIFRAPDLEMAKAIILNPTLDMTTAERWEVETRNLVEELVRLMGPGPESRILDYGCGVGRVAKALIERSGCYVVGADISAEMRQFAHEYVRSERFSVCDPETLDSMVQAGFRATHGYTCWVLQHCARPAEDIVRIDAALAPGALLYVLNSDHRWVPTDRGWASDGISIEALLQERFDLVAKSGVADLVGSATIAGESYSLVLRKRA